MQFSFGPLPFWANISIALATALGSLHRVAAAAAAAAEGAAAGATHLVQQLLLLHFSAAAAVGGKQAKGSKKKKKKKLLIECKHVTRLCLRLQALPYFPALLPPPWSPRASL